MKPLRGFHSTVTPNADMHALREEDYRLVWSFCSYVFGREHVKIIEVFCVVNGHKLCNACVHAVEREGARK